MPNDDRKDKVFCVASVLRAPIQDVIFGENFASTGICEDQAKRIKSIRRRMERLIDLLTDEELEALYGRFLPKTQATKKPESETEFTGRGLDMNAHM